MTRILFLLAAGAAFAHDASLDIRRAAPRVISINSDSEIDPAAPDPSATFAQVLAPDGAIVQILFRLERPAPNAVDLVGLQCRAAASTALHDFDLFGGQPACGVPALTGAATRTLYVHLAGFKSSGMKRAENIFLSSTLQLQGAPEMQILSADPGARVISLAIEPADLPALHQALVEHKDAVTVLLKPSAKDPLAPRTATVLDVQPRSIAPGTAPKLTLTLSEPIPRRPDPVTVVVTVPRAVLAAPIASRLQPDDPGLVAATKVAAPSGPPWLDLDVTFSSVVNRKNQKLVTTGGGERLTAGLFNLKLAKDLPVADFRAGSGFGAVLWRNTFTADVSTLNQADFDAPTQIAAGSELELQLERGAAVAEYFRGIYLIAGYRHESDRDLKFQLAFARFGISPVLPFLNQTRAQRARRHKGSAITAIRVQPAFYYDAGGVVRDRPQRLIPNVEVDDRVSRTVASLDLRLEIRRYFALTATDQWTHIVNALRRPNRNYLSAGMEISTGYLFGPAFLGGIENSVIVKWQRGELAPEYKPVNAFSIGFKLTR